MSDGFDFLGVHLRLCRVRKPKAKLNYSCRIWPSDRSMLRIHEKMKAVIGRRYSMTLEAMIKELNPVPRGPQQWATKSDTRDQHLTQTSG